MKIALVHNAYQQAGGEDAVFAQERKMLENAGNEIVAYCRTNWDTDSYRGLHRISLAKRTIWASDSRRDFQDLLRLEKPDLVHVHNTFVMISPSIYSACSQARVPVVQTLHNYRLLCLAANFFRDGKVCEECLGRSLWPGVQHACYRGSYSASAVVATMLTSHRVRSGQTPFIRSSARSPAAPRSERSAFPRTPGAPGPNCSPSQAPGCH